MATMMDKNYSGFVHLYTNPDTQTGYIGTMYFQILTTFGSAIIKVWSEESPLNATWNISVKEGSTTWGTSGYLYQGELTEVDITEQRQSAVHYDSWEVSVSAFETDDVGNLLYSGYYNTILGIPNQITGMSVSNSSPYSTQTITLSWNVANSTDNDNFPIKGMVLGGSYYTDNPKAWHGARCFPTNAMVGDIILNGMVYPANTTSCQVDLSTLDYTQLPGSPISFSITPFLYWEDFGAETENYSITPIFGHSNTGAIRLYITMVNPSSFVLYVKDSEGNFLLGETMFVKDSNGNWRQAESIMQFN